MGKGTIDTTTHGLNKGKNGSYSDNYQQTGRELLTSDEVRMLDNRYALLFIRGERPVRDEKFDILKHPNVRFTTDGGAKPYLHGGTGRAVATLRFAKADGQSQATYSPQRNIDLAQYELLSEADLEEQFKEVKES
jgi:type IV secretion system protein VirD4